ncbi:hypothetical protein CALCODRAFT_559015, partial [Calocera cornea HHB12733]
MADGRIIPGLVEDEGRVRPLLVYGDKIMFRMEGGTVHQVRVDFTHTKTHPNFPPPAPYKVLRTRAIKAWKTARLSVSYMPSLSISTSITTSETISVGYNVASKALELHTADYRIHEDGTLSGRKLPPLPAGGAYTLAYVDIPPYPTAWNRGQDISEAHSLSPSSDRTKVDRMSPYMRYSELPPIPDHKSRHVSKQSQRHHNNDSNRYKSSVITFRVTPEKCEVTKAKKASAAQSVVRPSKSKKRKWDDPTPLIVRIRRPQKDIPQKLHRTITDSEDDTEADEHICCWSTAYMYPLTEREHTMKYCAVESDAPPALRASLRAALREDLHTFEDDVHPTTSHGHTISTNASTTVEAGRPGEAEITRLAIMSALAFMGRPPLSFPPSNMLQEATYTPLLPRSEYPSSHQVIALSSIRPLGTTVSGDYPTFHPAVAT